MLPFVESNLLLIDPSINHYKEGHEYYDKAQQFLNLPILEYVPLIKNAEEVHVTDSAFCSLAKFSPTKTQKGFVYNKSGYSLSKTFFKGWEIR